MTRTQPLVQDATGMSFADASALLYVALPTIIFLAGWIVFPFGLLAALLVAAALVAMLAGSRTWALPVTRATIVSIVVVAALWTLFAGLGHWVYANLDWTVRDAVLVDLVRDAWPVLYHVDGSDLLLRAPIGYFLPAALVGKLCGIAVAEQALMVWTLIGVVLTFTLMMRDRPGIGSAMVRVAIFIAFSGMDIVGTFARYNRHDLGDHLEWWAFLYQYSSQTTQLFWVPNHALPGWIAIAWLLGQDPKRLSTTTAAMFVLFAPLWSPLTALGIAPIVGVAIIRRLVHGRFPALVRTVLDWRLLVTLLVCMALVFPYLVAGSDTVASGSNASVRWVGEDVVPRYFEFVLIEFVGFALVLVGLRWRDPLLWTAIALLLALPLYRFGPFNDLAMRTSIPGLTLLAIELGRWLSTPGEVRRHRRKATVAVLLLGIGAVTPFMEFARVFIKPAWPLDTHSSVVDVTRGTHYLTSPDRPWLRRFVEPLQR